MELLDLKYLTASADTGKFVSTAEALGVNTSTISRRVGHLEDELGLALFERDGSGIRLTAGGHVVIRHARRVLLEVDRIREVGKSFAAGNTGEVRLGVRAPPIGGPSRTLLKAWRAAHPRVALAILEGSERELLVALAEHRLDVALIVKHLSWPAAVTLSVYRERLMVALPEDHHLSERAVVDWESLGQETILMQAWDDSQAAREYYASLLGNADRFQVHSASKQTILALVGAGVGVALTIESQSEATFPGVVFRPIDEANAWLEFDLAWLKETEDPTVGRFVAFMRDESRARNFT